MSFYHRNRDNLKLGHLNVNSLRHKFDPLAEILQKNVLDVLMLQEIKLDDSFPPSQFYVSNFKVYRKDVNAHCGGLMMYVRGDLPQRRRYDLEECNFYMSGRIEIMVLEINLRKDKWLCCNMYKQPVYATQI